MNNWENLCRSCFTIPYLKRLPNKGPIKTINEIVLEQSVDFNQYVEDEDGSDISSTDSSSDGAEDCE